MVLYKVLGPFSVHIDGKDRSPSAEKVRQVLALTLLRANQTVTLDSIIEELWGDRSPRSAVATTQTYVYQIRKLLAGTASEAPGGGHVMRTVARGYALSVGPDQLDSWDFERRLERAQALLSEGNAEEAAPLLRGALALWTGSALSDVPRGALLQGYTVRLEEKRMLALELQLRAEMRLGHYREIIAELRSLVLTYPFHEWFHAQLMITLHRTGRRGDALEAFRNVRCVLRDQLGIEPSSELRRIHQEILQADRLPART